MKNILKKAVKYILLFIILMIMAYIVTAYFIQKVHVHGNSMEPTYKSGDIIWVDKQRYRCSLPRRYDVIMFRYDYGGDKYYIKRVIGLPGETVQIIDGSIFIDGIRLENEYGFNSIEDARLAKYPVLVGENEYFVLGDNRNDCADSRDYDIGNVKISQIYGYIINSR